MLRLPVYVHDNPILALPHNDVGSNRATRYSANKIKSVTLQVPTVAFSQESLDTVVQSDTPTIFELDRFNPGDFLIVLNKFAANDQHTYCTSNGAHNTGGLKMREVFNIRQNKNVHRIEDGIYPEKALPAQHVTDILNQSCPPNYPLLQVWLETKTYVDDKYAKNGYDPETRAIMIVTGNCSGLTGTHQQGGVWIDNTGQRVPPHFDEYTGLGFLGQDEKDVFLCSPDVLDIKIWGNSHINERHDIDPLFCEDGIWHIARLKAGQMLYMPMGWWNQVCFSSPAHVLPPSLCVSLCLSVRL